MCKSALGFVHRVAQWCEGNHNETLAPLCLSLDRRPKVLEKTEHRTDVRKRRTLSALVPLPPHVPAAKSKFCGLRQSEFDNIFPAKTGTNVGLGLEQRGQLGIFLFILPSQPSPTFQL